jgi:crotonobetainyl-CoA:carnitine CoA-transferase CaiB-like acyl-CoA transferase
VARTLGRLWRSSRVDSPVIASDCVPVTENASPEPLSKSRLPLDGVLIADFSRVLAGPYCTMLLADMGATVIKVESPQGDETRRWLPPERDGVSTYYLGINRNKRSIALNLSDSDDLVLARRLIARADVVVENFMPGTMSKFGLDYPTVTRDNPRLIYASISGFGTGAGATIPGYDLMIQAISGLMSLTGDPEGPAMRAGMPAMDVIAGLHAGLGILSALHQRHETGKGHYVEVSLLMSALSGLVNHSSAHLAGGEVPYRMGNAHPSLFPYEPFPTSDGAIVVIAGNDAQFSRLCEVIDSPDLAEDPRFARNEDRVRNRDVLAPLLCDQLRQRSTQEWFDRLLSANVPCAPIHTIDEGFTFAQRIGLDPIADVGDVALPMARNPVTFSQAQISYDTAPPALDEHGDEIRAWLSSGG